MPYDFRRMRTSDLSMVNGWIKTPHVRRWWTDADGGSDAPLDEASLRDPDSRQWIVHLDGKPFAFIQDYDPHAQVGHHFAFLPKGSRGIDQFIGIAEWTGHAHGPNFIRAHVECLAREGAPAIGTDPHPDNAVAIRAYEKLGFVSMKKARTAWGPSLLMVLEIEDAGR